MNFTKNVREWWKQLTPSQRVAALRWLFANMPPKDWRGTNHEWAYLNMPPSVTQ